jgi:aspartyl-tRNA(Asn)/glutamyl-tRNA(Gln) amidotransferase subunit C
MSSESSPVRPEIVRQIAALARLRVPESELDAWTRQLGRIVAYIDQLKEIPDEESLPVDPLATPLRADEPVSGPGLAALESNAPRLPHGLGAVPRVVGGRPAAEEEP